MVTWKDENEKGREKKGKENKRIRESNDKKDKERKGKKTKKRKINVNTLFKILCPCTTTKTIIILYNFLNLNKQLFLCA